MRGVQRNFENERQKADQIKLTIPFPTAVASFGRSLSTKDGHAINPSNC
jgi:hypothetical protein